MRVFVTGATGFIGQAVVNALLKAGHGVSGLARSDAKAAELEKAGAKAIRGDMAQPATWRAAAAEHDALVHAAVDYASDTPAKDRACIEGLIEAAQSGKAKSLVFTSGVWVLGNCPSGAGEDASTAEPFAGVTWRPAHEQRVLSAARETLHTAVLRPGLVYGGHGSLTGDWFATATKDGAARVVGDGKNHVPYVHRDDLAQLYRLVLEHAAGGIFHGVDGASLTQLEAATAASQAAGCNGKVNHVSREDAKKTMGGLSDALCIDQVVRAPRALALGWKPARASFASAAAEAFGEWKKAGGH
ncbi:MAG: NAD-dependent epimerase/dehydratase family protein [Deltaproteobacteria bacterium]|nr:NAD-dependent epimerase/dehydratase family protein [Deltaproteobacteria bacterium]